MSLSTEFFGIFATVVTNFEAKTEMSSGTADTIPAGLLPLALKTANPPSPANMSNLWNLPLIEAALASIIAQSWLTAGALAQ